MRTTLLICFAALTIFGAGTTWAQDEFLFQAQHGPNDTWNLYERGEIEDTWALALETAQGMERMGVTGDLASIHSIEENSTVHFVGGGQEVWIGLTDREGAAPLLDQNGALSPQESIELEGKGAAAAFAKWQGWAWTSGEPFNFHNWNGGEPGNGGDAENGTEDAAHIWPGGDWNDAGTGYFEDEPVFAELQEFTSRQETEQLFPYVVEYRTEATTSFAGIPIFTPAPPAPPPADAIAVGIDTFLAESESAQRGPDGAHGDVSEWEWDGEDAGGQNVGLLWFDIPQATLNRLGNGTATLKMQVSNPGDNADVYRVTVDWLSGPNGGDNVTYNNFPGGPSIVPGDNLEDVASFFTDPVVVGEVEFDVTEDLLAWASGVPNYGWGFIPTGGGGSGVRSFEHPSGEVPLLFLELELPPGDFLTAGDSNMDLEFNQLDLVQVQIAAKYLTGQAATWGEGDWNAAPGGTPGSPPIGDGLFNQIDIIAALNAGTYLQGRYAALAPDGTGSGNVTITYNPADGEVGLDVGVTELTSINIDSAAAIFTGEPAQNLGGSFDNDADNNIFKATFGSSFGSLSFGMVAQPGLSEEFVRNDLSAVGSLLGGGDLGVVDLHYIPEPSTMALLGLGLVGALVVRRRRHS